MLNFAFYIAGVEDTETESSGGHSREAEESKLVENQSEAVEQKAASTGENQVKPEAAATPAALGPTHPEAIETAAAPPGHDETAVVPVKNEPPVQSVNLAQVLSTVKSSEKLAKVEKIDSSGRTEASSVPETAAVEPPKKLAGGQKLDDPADGKLTQPKVETSAEVLQSSDLHQKEERASEGRSEELTRSLGTGVVATKLPGLAKGVDTSLSVTVVSNGPTTSMAMNKSISPVIKAVSSSKPIDIVTSVSVASTVTVTTHTSSSKTGSVLYTGSVTAPVVSSLVRPAATSLCAQTTVTVTTVPNKPPVTCPVTSAHTVLSQKVVRPVENTPIPTATAHGVCISTAQSQTQLAAFPSVSVVSSKPKVLEPLSTQSRTVPSVPLQAKVCIVTTVGNTKVAIHTLNSTADSSQKTTGQPTLLRPIQAGSKFPSDPGTNVNSTASIFIRDVTRKAEATSVNENSGNVKLDVLKPRIPVGVAQTENSMQIRQLPQELITSARLADKKLAGLPNRVVNYNLQHGQTSGVSQCVLPTVSKVHENKETLQDRIESIVNASQGKCLDNQRMAGASALLSKQIPTANELKDGNASQGTVTPATRLAPSPVVATTRESPLSATSNLDSGAATAAIQAVAAHVKAAQSSASQQTSTSPPEQQKRSNQSKGVSILKPLYDREFDLDDNEMDPQVSVTPHSQVSPKKPAVVDCHPVPKKSEETSASKQVSMDNTAFSIAQILDHAKRAMAEERQQKELKASLAKDKSKNSTGKAKVTKPQKSVVISKTFVQPVGAAPANPKTPEFPFSSSVHLANFVQKSKQTPTPVNSAVHASSHPIMAPEFHLNLTESVQKVMQAIPGTETLSPPPCPPRVVRPGSVFPKFGEEKAAANSEGETVESSAVTSTTTAASVVVVTTSSPVSVPGVPVASSTVTTSSFVAPVTSHKVSPSQSAHPVAVSPVSVSPGSRILTSPHKAPTPPAATQSRNTPTPPAAVTALRNTQTPPAAAVLSPAHHVVPRKTPTPPAATVPPVVMRKAPTPPAAISQALTGVRVVSPHPAVNRNTSTPPCSRNTPTPPGTSTVIHSRSPHSTPPAKEVPKVKGTGVKFEIMPQPHGASTIVVIKSDNKDVTPPPTSDATQTIILGHKDLLRKATVSSGKTENVTVITTHKSEALRKMPPTIIVPSSTVASSSAAVLSHIPVQKQTAAALLSAKVQPSSWKRADGPAPPIRSAAPQLTQIPRMTAVTPITKHVSLQSRIVQSKPITAITVVNPAKQMVMGTNVASLANQNLIQTTSSAHHHATTSHQLSSATPSLQATEPVVTSQPVRLLVTTVKPSIANTKPREVEAPVATHVVEARSLEKVTAVEVAKPVAVATTSQISPSSREEVVEDHSKTLVKKPTGQRTVEKEERIVEQEQPNNNNKNEKTPKKSGDGGHGSDDAPRPARVSRRRSRESTESQQSTANSESGRSTRSSRKRGASESSDISISSDGHNVDAKSTTSTRSSVDRSESPCRGSRHSTRSTTRKQTSAEREEAALAAVVKSLADEKERSVSPATGKGTRASKRKLAMEESSEEHPEPKKTKADTSSGKPEEHRSEDTNESEVRSRRPGMKQDAGKTNTNAAGHASGSKRPASRAHKAETVDIAEDHSYSGSRRAHTRSSGNSSNAETKEEHAKKSTPAHKKGNVELQLTNSYCECSR